MSQKPDPSRDQQPQNHEQPLDFSQVVRRSRNMLNPELTIDFNSNMGDPTALCARLLVQVATVTDKSLTQPDTLHLSELTPGSIDLVARPTVEKGPSTVDIKWVGRKKKEPRIDLQKLLLLGRFKIEHGMRAYIPVERPQTGDARLIFYFSRARFAEIRKGGKRKGNSSTDQHQGGATAAGQ